jgi:large subunit ribosomal protein L31
MKAGIHPDNYRMVIFRDISNDEEFLTRSCAPSKENATFSDGNEYPVIKVEISNSSHPFFTGKMKFVDTAGRIEKFKNKYTRKTKAAPIVETTEEAAEETKEA